jgi:hypothetical protein
LGHGRRQIGTSATRRHPQYATAAVTTFLKCEFSLKYAVNGGLKSPEAHGVISHDSLTE